MSMSPGIIVLVGADGAGKSTQARRLCSRIGARAMHIYMGSNPSAITHALPSTKAWARLKRALGRRMHHRGPPETPLTPRPSRAIDRGRGHLKSLAVLALRASEELYRLLIADLSARRGRLVIMDRHPYPDYYMRRVRGTTGWLRWGDRMHGFLLERIYPRPMALILLDAPAEVLYERKPEGSLAAVRARREEYLEMARTLSDVDVTIVDAARSEDEVLTDLLRIAQGDGTAASRRPLQWLP